jgi:CBS domain-containing protein
LYPTGLRSYSVAATTAADARKAEISSAQTVGNLTEKELVTLPEDTIIADAVTIMKDKGISSVFVRSVSSSSESPYITGIVTERDILYRVIGSNKGPYKTLLRDIMSSPVVTIDAGASVAEAISIMRSKSFRRLLVARRERTKKGQLGSITLMSIIADVPLESISY